MTNDTILLTSRSFAEYIAFFNLDPNKLPGRIVDVSAGASSFVAEATRRGVDALAVDPAYQEKGSGHACRRAWPGATSSSRLTVTILSTTGTAPRSTGR